MAKKSIGYWALAASALLLLSACEEGSNFSPFTVKANADDPVGTRATSVELIERDVESPDVFQVTEDGLWDGRPSLGGVWVAHPTATDPERVIIRNQSNGKFVIGALFRREFDNPGPKLQVSSDAAAALGMLAGQPTALTVVALRREEVAPEPVPEAAAVLDAPEQIEQSDLDPVTAAAEAAIDAAEAETPVVTPAPSPMPTATITPVARPFTPTVSLAKPYVQLGLFSVEANANRTADLMRSEGIVPTVDKQTSNGKTFWRLIVGPAASRSDKTALLKKIKSLGFSDAYFVSN